MNFLQKIGKAMSAFLDAFEAHIAGIPAAAGVTDAQVQADITAALVPTAALVTAQAQQITDLETALNDLAAKLAPGAPPQPTSDLANVATAAVAASTQATAANTAAVTA